jgi:hypothetical protein
LVEPMLVNLFISFINFLCLFLASLVPAQPSLMVPIPPRVPASLSCLYSIKHGCH